MIDFQNFLIFKQNPLEILEYMAPYNFPLKIFHTSDQLQ